METFKANKMDKKAQSSAESIWVIIKIVLALVIIMLIIAWTFPNFFSFGDVLKGEARHVSSDADGDGLANFQDDCPCIPGEIQFNGCPVAYSQEELDKLNEGEYAFNTDTGCNELVDLETANESALPFKTYRSIEVLGTEARFFMDWEREGVVSNTCSNGLLGVVCPSTNNYCDGAFEDAPGGGCSVLGIDEHRAQTSGSCVFGKVSSGTIVGFSLSKIFSPTSKDSLQISKTWLDTDPRDMFLEWSWRSTPQIGELICKNNLWYSCTALGEGEILDVTYSGKNERYTCVSGTWNDGVAVNE